MAWSDLFAALRHTLLERATLPLGAATPEGERAQRTHQSRVERDLEWADGLTFDAEMDDAMFWRIAAPKPFYSGKRAGSIRTKVERAEVWLRDYRALAGPEWVEDGATRLKYEADESAYRNRKDLPRILKGARNIARRQQINGGKRLVDIFIPPRDRDFSAASLERIYKAINGETGFGFVTTLHLMTDLGLPVVKTDRVLTRMVIRLGLVTHRSSRGVEEVLPRDLTADHAMRLGSDPDFSFRIQERLQEAAAETGLSMRAVDWLLVKMGMEPDAEAGFVRTICGDKPLCHECKVRPMCRLGQSR